MRITHVLCPIDFSETSQHALDHASAVAHWYSARLTVLYTFVNLPTMDLPPIQLQAEERAGIEARMRRAAAAVPASIPQAFVVDEAVSAPKGILAQVRETGADLLVLGTHGRSGVQHLVLGSVTEKVIRQATCPTLVVPPRASDVATDAAIRFRKILCPVDFSATSLQALEMALDLAKEADARLTLLHVVPLPAILGEESIALQEEMEAVRTAAVTEARRRLTALIPDQARAFCTVETSVVEGSAQEAILSQADDGACDLIVMGVHGRRALDIMVFGSTTHSVIRAAKCPVLVVRGRRLTGEH